MNWIPTIRILAAIGLCAISLAAVAPRLEATPAAANTFAVAGQSFRLDPYDLGPLANCPPDVYVGLVLTDGKGTPIWSMNVRDLATSLIDMKKCPPGLSKAWVERIVPLEREVHFAVSVLNCGASCADLEISVFRFDARQVHLILADKAAAGIKLQFPRIIVYTAEVVTCNACPRRWKRTVYQWRGERYELVERKTHPTLSETNPWKD